MRMALMPMLASAFHVEAERVLGPRRGSAEIVRARHSAMYLGVFKARLTLTETASLFARDRRGVAYAVCRLEAERDADPDFDAAMNDLGDEFQRRLDAVRAAYGWTAAVDGGRA